MANKNNNVNFDIPVPIIILAFIFCWPVGIVLTILRSISIPVNKNARTEGKNSFERTEQRNSASNKKRGKGKNMSTGTKVTRFFAIFLGILSLITVCAFAGSSAGLSFFLRDFLTGVCPILVGSVSCGIASKILGDRDTRFGRIRAIIGNRESINLTKLAAASNEKLKNVRRDVQKMIDNGEFGDYAYIDLGTNNFMRSPYSEPDEPEQFDFRKVYGDVLKKEKKQAASESSEEITTETTSKEADSDDFAKIISEIRRLNDEIADVQVSDRIDRIEEHTKNIFEYVTDHPESMPQIRTFMNYYLPTTLKLLESYSRIERVGVAGENMKKSKEKIESILDLLVIGFEQQVDQLFKNESIDISSDISVLEKMMQKDGLSGKNDFDTSKYDEFTDSYTDEIADVFGAFGSAAAQSAPESDADSTNSAI